MRPLALLLGSLIVPALAAADVPRLLSHEGRVLRSDGTPERGALQMTFRIYDVEFAGSPVWTESIAVPLSAGGYYATHLGRSSVLPALDGAGYWLGVTIDGEPEMAPRTRLVSVPFALRAGDANKVGGDPAAEIARRADPVDATKVTGVLPVASMPAPVVLLNSSNLIPAQYLPSLTGSVSDTFSDLAVGQCRTLTHGFGTLAITYQAWMTDTGTWVPMSYVARDGQTNLALNRPTGASGYYTTSGPYPPNLANDGQENCTSRWLVDNGAVVGWWQVDLGSVTVINRVRVRPDVACTTAITAWEVQISSDGTAFSQKVADGACVAAASCNGYIDHVFSPVAARYVRINASRGEHPTTNGIIEAQVFGATYPVTLPNVNQIQLCNYTGLTRHFTLIVSH